MNEKTYEISYPRKHVTIGIRKWYVWIRNKKRERERRKDEVEITTATLKRQNIGMNCVCVWMCWIRIYKSVVRVLFIQNTEMRTTCIPNRCCGALCCTFRLCIAFSFFFSFHSHTYTLTVTVIKSTRSRYVFFSLFSFFNSLWFCIRAIFVYLISSQMHTYFILHTNHKKEPSQ